MKKSIEKMLTDLGYTNIIWHEGRRGYYVTAMQYNLTTCIDIVDFVNEILRRELSAY